MPVGVSAFTPLANVTLGASTSSVTFSSISQSFRDLVIIANFVPDFNSLGGLTYRINGDTGSNYSRVFMQGNGSATLSASGTSARIYLTGNASVTAGTNANVMSNFMDYSATDKHKTVLSRSNAAANFTVANASRWANTDAITSIYIDTDGGTFAAGSSFSLYGVSA